MTKLVIFMLVRLLLPMTLIIVSLARPVGISFAYLIMFFISPWLQTKGKRQRSLLRIYMIVLCFLCSLVLIGHILVNLTYLFFIEMASTKSFAYVLRQIGFLYFKGVGFGSIAHWILPDISVLVNTITFFIFFKMGDKKKKFDDDLIQKNKTEKYGTLKLAEVNRLLIICYIKSILKTCKYFSPIFSLIVIFFAATLRPSLPGSLYFLIFIIAGTYWALYRQLHRGIYYLLIFMVVALLIHIVCICAYQMPILRLSIKTNTIWTRQVWKKSLLTYTLIEVFIRMMGMELLLRLSQESTSKSIIELSPELKMYSYLSPIALSLAYFVSTLSLINHSQYELTFNNISMNLRPNSNEYSADAVLKNDRKEFLDDVEPSMLEQVFYMVFDVTSFIYKNSYILLNIFMMIWSIVYHSWLTFVLLIWANVLWMIPNQRRSMMRSSFFVVLYAEFLLISQYIYGMNINENELPTKVSIFTFNLEQVGFVHPQNKGSPPWISLTVKTGFLLVFWITSRQYFKEKTENRTRDDLLQQIFGPHHSRSEHLLFEKSQAPQLIVYFFKSVSNFITRIWMWLLIFLIFLCAMIDSAMTGFRICYMSLFLLFLMVFQMSLQLWIKFLYGYWIFLIFYAMTILTVIYTYQFDNFDKYWETYLKVQIKIQQDIGLRRCETKDLFLHLLIPTLTVIFTVVQLHYFHRRFMDSVRRPTSAVGKSKDSHILFTVESDTLQDPFDAQKQSWKVFFSAGYRMLRSRGHKLFRPGKIIVWGFLEMHMIKAVILASFFCAISEVCFFNIFLVFLSLVSVCVNRFVRRIVFRTKNCTANFAEWMGLRKTKQNFRVHLRYISPYIIYMIITSLHAVVKLRNHLIRYSMDDERDRKVLFPYITRQDAEHDFPGLLKYILNYGFYKFGLEITLIGLVSTIVHRRDHLALTYVIWLIILLCLNRIQCARIWEIFQLYFVLSIFVQYLYILNFPPNVCVSPTNDLSYIYGNKSNWLNFDDSMKFFYKSKLLVDFIILMFISRQRKSFKAEIRHITDLSYPGGDNINVVYNVAKLGHVYFENPTHDFCSYVRNYADVFKTAVFCSFFWVTLGVVFMGGVCSMDILSLGYIIFALIFLLQGSEVYLQNIHYILCRWNCLIAFNIFNIIVKVAIVVLEDSITNDQQQIFQAFFSILHQEKHDMQMENLYEQKKNHENQYGPKSMVFENTLVWHAIIFSFVIFQHRIFRSYYFCHVIMDTQANTILASRGAAIIENLHYKQIYDRREYEKNVLESVKAKMERIRASNKKKYKRKL
ncbi:hypothetical protein KR018_002866 [Drosophila ironensis]|nr:hypothetical protein KR018_002866 [Drosophila ironensis]